MIVIPASQSMLADHSRGHRPRQGAGTSFSVKSIFPRYGDPHVKDKTAVSLIFNMVIPILVRQHFYIETAPDLSCNTKMTFYQYRKSHCGDKMVVRSSYLHSGIFYSGKLASLHWTIPRSISHLILLLLATNSSTAEPELDMMTTPWYCLHYGGVLVMLPRYMYQCVRGPALMCVWVMSISTLGGVAMGVTEHSLLMHSVPWQTKTINVWKTFNMNCLLFPKLEECMR